MTWIPWHQLLIALAATLVLAAVHFFIPWIYSTRQSPSKVFNSFAGGVAVAYVFLHMLPELVEQNAPMGELLKHFHWLSPFVELAIFVTALVGFLLYYGVEITAERAKQPNQTLVYQLHLGMFLIYNFLITYTMALRVETGVFFTILFTIAMLLHFFLIDKKFNRLYPNRFSHTGRFFLVAGLLLGWVFSVIFDPVNVLVVALMTAFLSGSVLLNIFREELPSANKASFSGFVVGALFIAVILLGKTYLNFSH